MGNRLRTLTNIGGVDIAMPSAYYTLDSTYVDATGQTIAADTSLGSFVPGLINDCIFLSGPTNQYLNWASNNSWTMTNGANDVPFSFSIWVNFTGAPLNNYYILSRTSNTNSSVGYTMVFSSSVSAIVLNKFTSTTIRQGVYSSFTVVPGAWSHIVYTDDGSATNAGMNLYFNGVIQSKTNSNAGVYTGMGQTDINLRAGQLNTTTTSENFKGKLDAFGIWKGYALSQTEITALYNGGVGRQYPF